MRRQQQKIRPDDSKEYYPQLSRDPNCKCPFDCTLHYEVKYLEIDGRRYFTAKPKEKN